MYRTKLYGGVRMLIDEAINIAKSDIKYNKSIGYDTSYEEQRAEGVEEVKIWKSVKNCRFITSGKAVEQFEHEIRNKAIDDFTEKIIRYVDCGHLCSPTEIIWSDLAVVEMVKKIAEQLKGGVSDDVCEWRLFDEEANVYDTSCRNSHILIEGTPKENNYEL